MRNFEVVAGSVTGREHIRKSTNNQDAYSIYEDDDLLVAVICDGCSGGRKSEVGANLGARLLTETIQRSIKAGTQRPTDKYFWERIRMSVLSQINVLAQSLGGSFSQTIREMFLFTIVGVLVTKED